MNVDEMLRVNKAWDRDAVCHNDCISLGMQCVRLF